jgi:hypothetical protein
LIFYRYAVPDRDVNPTAVAIHRDAVPDRDGAQAVWLSTEMPSLIGTGIRSLALFTEMASLIGTGIRPLALFTEMPFLIGTKDGLFLSLLPTCHSLQGQKDLDSILVKSLPPDFVRFGTIYL